MNKITQICFSGALNKQKSSRFQMKIVGPELFHFPQFALINDEEGETNSRI